MEKYIALVHKSGTEYGISFPDVLGCSSGGDSFEQAVANGAVALAGHIEALLQEGLAVPVARSLEAIKAAKEDWVDWDRAIVTAIPLLPTAGRTVRVNITADRAHLDLIDKAAKSAGMSRSDYLVQSATANATIALRAAGAGMAETASGRFLSASQKIKGPIAAHASKKRPRAPAAGRVAPGSGKRAAKRRA